jgi:F0F1-type ATP synthase gamma subunit
MFISTFAINKYLQTKIEYMITIQDVEYFNETISNLERAILNIDLFNSNVYDYYLNVIQKHAEFQRAFKFKILPETARSYNIFKRHFYEFLMDVNSLTKDPNLKRHKQFMQKIYYDMKTLSLELQAIQINLDAEKNTLDLLLKFPNWLVRHHQNGDFYNYAWVYDKVSEIESDAPRFFSLFANEFNEMRNLAMDASMSDRSKRQRMDELVDLLIRLTNDMLRASVE